MKVPELISVCGFMFLAFGCRVEDMELTLLITMPPVPWPMKVIDGEL